MPGLVPIQQKFLALLQGTITFFSTPQPQSVQDRKMVDQLRTDALRLAEESRSPAFESFLAYLLGGTAVEAHYPLQAIRMLCIVARSAQLMSGLHKPQLEELLTAAFFCDIGFRAAWLGQKGSHAELTAYRLKEMQFAWFTPSLEKMLLFHHVPAQDISPHRALSMTSNYLAYSYGLGVDTAPAMLLSPVKALEAMLEEFSTENDGIHLLLRTLSAYPIGSWVQTNTGQVGLIIGGNSVNPLRPRIGYAVANPQGGWRWEEHALQGESRVNLQRELLPNTAQTNFVNMPHLWMAGWQSQGTFSKEDYVNAFGEPLSTDGSVSSPPSLQKFLGDSTKTTNAPPLQPRTANDPAAASTAPLPALPSSAVNENELNHLRADWEKHVHQIEESVSHLRHGLIDSYRRENDQFRKTIDELAKQTPATNGSSETAPLASLTETITHYLTPLEEMIPAEEKRLRDQHAGLDELCKRVRTALEALPRDGSRGDRLKELIARWQKEWDTVAADLIDPLHPLPKAFLDLKEQCAAARAYATRLPHQTHKDDPNILARSQAVWEGRHRAALEKSKTLAEEAGHEQRRCMERVQRFAERYLELAENLKNH